MLVADRPPSGIESIDERLRSRFEGGLVVEVDTGVTVGDLVLVDADVPEPGADRLWGTSRDSSDIPPLEELEVGDREGLFSESAGTGVTTAAGAEASREAEVAVPAKRVGAWFPSHENVVLHWPEIHQLLQEELD